MKRKERRKVEGRKKMKKKEETFMFSCSCVSCYQTSVFQLSKARPRGRGDSAGPFIPVNWTEEQTVTDILVLCGFLARHT